MLFQPAGHPSAPASALTQCRTFKSCWPEDKPVPATAQAGCRVPCSQLVYGPCTITAQAKRQSAERAYQASWMTRWAPPLPKPGGSVPSMLVQPAGRPAAPAIAHAAQQSAEGASPVVQTNRLCTPPLGRGAECRASIWSTRRAPSPPRPGGKVPSMQVRPAGRPAGHHHSPGRAAESQAC